MVISFLFFFSLSFVGQSTNDTIKEKKNEVRFVNRWVDTSNYLVGELVLTKNKMFGDVRFLNQPIGKEHLTVFNMVAGGVFNDRMYIGGTFSMGGKSNVDFEFNDGFDSGLRLLSVGLELRYNLLPKEIVSISPTLSINSSGNGVPIKDSTSIYHKFKAYQFFSIQYGLNLNLNLTKETKINMFVAHQGLLSLNSNINSFSRPFFNGIIFGLGIERSVKIILFKVNKKNNN